jgi:hypothetical protein
MSFSSNPLYLHKPAFSSKYVQSSIESFLKDWLSRHEIKPEGELFHYTSLEGLKGILSNRSLWFSHASTLNDPLELQYGREVINEVINESIKNNSDNLLRPFYDQLKIQLNTMGDLIHHPFITCFCEEGDLLSQWRAYAQKGVGYSIGFKFNSQTQLATQIDELENGRPLFLRKVIYKPEDQKELVQNYLDKVLPIAKKEINKMKESENDTYPSAVIGIQASNPLIDLMLCFKHPAFHEEKEWRLMRVTRDNFDAENLKFRENEDSLIPYRSLFFYNNSGEEYEFPCTSIINGPSSETDNKASIELYLHHLATDNHPIAIKPHKVVFKNAGYSLR